VTSDSKIGAKDFTRHCQDYEPTNAIYTNTSDYRRWCRVTEWFSHFGPDAENYQRTLGIQQKWTL